MEKIEWRTESRRVKDLIPFSHNPRKMTKEQARQLVNSLEKFNYVELVAIQPDNRIISGHMRIKALKQMGRGNDEIEVRVPNQTLSEEDMKEYLIRSNRNTGEWDWDLLANAFDPHDLHAWGFDAEELAEGILDIDSEEDKSAEDLEKCAACGQKLRKKNNGSS